MSKGDLLKAPLNIEEEDGSPSLFPWKLVVSDNTLTDNGDGTASLNLVDSVTITCKVGEAAGISKGQPVYVSGATGELPRVELADNTVHANAHLYGIANETKTLNQNIDIVIRGEVIGFDTDAISSAEGDRIHLGASGVLQSVVPTSGAHIHVGFVSKRNAVDGILLVAIESYVHDIRGVSGIDVELATGSDADTEKISFQNYSGSELGYIGGSGLFSWAGLGSIANTWTWTGGGINLNDALPLRLGTLADNDYALLSGTGGVATLDLDTAGNTCDFTIKTSQHNNNFFVNEDTGAVMIGGDGTEVRAMTAVGLKVMSEGKPINFLNTSSVVAIRADRLVNDSSSSKLAIALAGFGAQDVSANNTLPITGLNAVALIINGSTGGNTSSGGLLAGRYIMNHAGSGALTNSGGISLQLTNTSSATITNLTGYNIEPIVNTGTIINFYGMFIPPVSQASTLSAGIWVGAQSGATTNYGLVLAGDGVGSGSIFGASQQVEEYFNGTNFIVNSTVAATKFIGFSDTNNHATNGQIELGSNVTNHHQYSNHIESGHD